MVRTTRRKGVGKVWFLWLVIAVMPAALGAQQSVWDKFDPHTIATLNLGTDDPYTRYWIVGEECPLGPDWPDCASQLHVARHSKGSTKDLLTYKAQDRLVCMYPYGGAGDHPLLVTFWGGASYYAWRIFLLTEEQVTLVFDHTSKADAEFVSGRSSETIILLNTDTQVTLEGIIPTKTEIYAWDGKAYKQLAKVPFEECYAALDKLTRKATK